MNFKVMQNNVIKNQDMIVISSSAVATLAVMLSCGILNSAILFFGMILPLYKIISIISKLLPTDPKSMTLTENYNSFLDLIKWNLILVNHFVLEFICSLIVFVNTFYVQLIQLIVLYVLHKFGDSINSSFQNTKSSDKMNNNIVLTDLFLVINQARFYSFNTIVDKLTSYFNQIDFNQNFIEMFSNYVGTETEEKIISHAETETEVETETVERVKESNKAVFSLDTDKEETTLDSGSDVNSDTD